METQIKKNKYPRKTKKWHKWVGLFFTFFLFMFAVSGIFLNHRRAISSAEVSRSILPRGYQYENWNNGSIRNSIKLSPDSILLYGNSGIWLTDARHTGFTSFTAGMKSGADNQIVANILRSPGADVFAVSTFDLYRLDAATDTWVNLSAGIQSRERFTDIAFSGDTLWLMTRSHLYAGVAPYRDFQQVQLPAPEGYVKSATLFRTLWTLHSGELFGWAGKILVDIVGTLVILLCVTGLLLTFCPSLIRRKKKKGGDAHRQVSLFKGSLNWHNKIGAWCLALFLVVCVSGMFLRPPLMIAIIRAKTKPVPGTTLDSSNPWFDKLRCLRYDTHDNEWILYSSEGFFTFPSIGVQPRKMLLSPPVSVMGVNVLQQHDSTRWIVASFSGIYIWDKYTGESFNYITGEPVARKRPGMPTLTDAVSGYSADFEAKEVVFEYGPGARTLKSDRPFAPMPDWLKREGRMSLWHLCLEVHVGRIYTFLPGLVGDLFVFISGTFLLILLLSGYIVYRKQYRKKR